MSGGIYLVQGDGGLVEMTEQSYASEDLLQELLAKHPNLLAGDQIDGEEPRRWLLVSREVSLASEEDGTGRWSVDHLFLDQDAIPTIVEVKRGTDTRIRREVVGQMLDYAANAVVYWPVDRLRARFEEDRPESEEDLADFLGLGTEPDEFWQKVKTNLQAGRVRLIFVSDEIPSELRRIVEFLNQQMDPAEVLAVEIKQYIGGNLKTLVPRVIGQTVEAQQKKSGGGLLGKPLDEDALFEEIKVRLGAEEAEIARRTLEWAKKKSDVIWWGKKQFTSLLKHKGHDHRPLAVSTSGMLKTNFNKYRELSLPDSEEKLQEFLDQLNSKANAPIPATTEGATVKLDLAMLKGEASLKSLLDALDWFVNEVKKS